MSCITNDLGESQRKRLLNKNEYILAFGILVFYGIMLYSPNCYFSTKVMRLSSNLQLRLKKILLCEEVKGMHPPADQKA